MKQHIHKSILVITALIMLASLAVTQPVTNTEAASYETTVTEMTQASPPAINSRYVQAFLRISPTPTPRGWVYLPVIYKYWNGYRYVRYTKWTPYPTVTATATYTPVPSPTHTSTPQSLNAYGRLVFARNVDDNNFCLNPQTTFPAGTTQVHACLPYDKIVAGTSFWGRFYLKRPGETGYTGLEDTAVVTANRNYYGGCLQFWVSGTDGSALPCGDYQFRIFENYQTASPDIIAAFSIACG